MSGRKTKHWLGFAADTGVVKQMVTAASPSGSVLVYSLTQSLNAWVRGLFSLITIKWHCSDTVGSVNRFKPVESSQIYFHCFPESRLL